MRGFLFDVVGIVVWFWNVVDLAAMGVFGWRVLLLVWCVVKDVDC